MAQDNRLEEEIRRLRGHLAAVEKEWDAARLAQDRLSTHTAEISAVLDATADGIVSVNVDRRIAEEALVDVTEAVRESIGQELHDVLGQQLTGMTLLAKGLETRLLQDGHPGAEEAGELGTLSRTALAETKRLAHGLYPTELERHGLAAALEELALTREKLFGIRCRLLGRVAPDLLWRSSALHLYRIAQEAVGNAVKHAATRSIDIELIEREDTVVVEVRDEGSGWQAESDSPGMGLTIMHYRARMIGATLTLRENRHGGTTVTCVLPVDRNASAPGDAP